jgi:PPOX class probable F420-dependent enzyme
MAVRLPEAAKRLLAGKNLAHVVTLMRDGSPQVTPVWVEFDGTHVLINTAEGREKPRNLRRDPRIALAVADQEDPYCYCQIRGKVIEITSKGAFEHITKLARKYRGPDAVYPRREGETRLIVRIEPQHVSVWPND